MKKIVVLMGCLFVSMAINAQTWDEWFRQKKTQKKYLLQQIAALKVYADYAQKGYEIAGKGVNMVRKIKDGDFGLHSIFFSSLKSINPAISKYARIADIIAYQLQIIKESKRTLRATLEANQFTAKEFDYCKRVLDHLLDECAKTMNDLLMLITQNELDMSDDERIKNIDRIYLEMKEHYSFCFSFSEEMNLLAVQRMLDQREILLSQKLNGFK